MARAKAATTTRPDEAAAKLKAATTRPDEATAKLKVTTPRPAEAATGPKGIFAPDDTENPVGDAAAEDGGWRQRAVERSLRTAKARAVSRSDRFIAAATELLDETGRTDFTVQEIVERSKMSLRSFYQHFASKDELLLALFEEVIRNAMERLRIIVFAHDDPVERLRTYVQILYGTVEGEPDAESRALTVYHLRLAESHPSEFAHALAPQIELLAEILQQGVAAGVVRADIDTRQLAMLVSQSLISALYMRVLGVHLNGVQVSGDDLWEFFFHGVAPRQSPAPSRAVRLGRRG